MKLEVALVKMKKPGATLHTKTAIAIENSVFVDANSTTC